MLPLPFWITATISVIGLTIGSITDFDRREVPDFLNFSLIAVGLCIGAINSFASMSWWPLLGSLGGLLVGYLVAAALFYTGQWGGGDAKMLMALGALHGVSLVGPESIITNWTWPLFGTLIIAIFVAGSVYSMVYFIGITIVRFKIVRKELQHLHATNKKSKYVRVGTLSILGTGLLSLLVFPGALGWMLFLLSLLIGGGILIIALARIVQEKVMVKKEHVAKLVPGDWLVTAVKQQGKVIVAQSKIGLVEKDIEVLKKHHVATVLVKEGIPFIPGFLLGYITILIAGNWIPLAWAYFLYVL